MSEKPIVEVSTIDRDASGHGMASARPMLALTIVSHPMARRAGERVLLEALEAGQEAALSRSSPDFSRPDQTLGRPLADPFLSRKPLWFQPMPDGGVRLRASESRLRVVVAGEPLVAERELPPEALERGVPLELSERVVVLLHRVSGEIARGEDLGMVGQSDGMRRVREDIARVADLDTSVLIRGETGAGKELVARALHQHSSRRQSPFVSVNMGALPKELAAAELFGARRGAYTGATQDREGFFRTAHGGTLFLDEVGEASPEVQALLLRVLETREVYPVGAPTPVPVDVRLVAATDANLEAQLQEGLFKAPLLHRLAGYEIHVPPLRERCEDIGPLFLSFALQELEAIGETWRLEQETPEAKPWLPASLAARLVRYAWPGNIRQLRNLTRQLIIRSRGQPCLQADPRLEQELERGAVPLSRQAPASAPPGASETPAPSRRKASEVGEQELQSSLRESGWDLKAAANRLGISRASLYDLIERSPHIRTSKDLSAEEVTQCFQECQGDLEAMVQRLEVSKRGLLRRMRELGLDAASS